MSFVSKFCSLLIKKVIKKALSHVADMITVTCVKIFFLNVLLASEMRRKKE